MNTQESRDHSFGIGLFTGALIGAGLAMWFAPRSSRQLRQRMADGAERLGQRAADQYQGTSARVRDAAGELGRTIREVRDDIVTVIAHDADEVERYVTATGSDRGIERVEAGSRRPL